MSLTAIVSSVFDLKMAFLMATGLNMFSNNNNNNNNNLTCKAPVCAKKTSVALADRTSR